MERGSMQTEQQIAQELDRAMEVPLRDAKGRLRLSEMSERDMAEETLAIARATQDMVEKFFEDLTTGKLNLPGPLGMLSKFMK
jgi:hypothetical protein